MKLIIGIIFLLFSVMASAQDETFEDSTSKPAITEIGKLIGKPRSKEINKDGGTLMSADGSIELIIPPGALTKKTTISIQEMTNMMPNGNGQSFRLEPSGIQFAQPVQIIFHYDPEESVDSAQLLKGIAMQDDAGQWYGLEEFVLDTTAKTISGMIDHFSIWASFDHLKLVAITGKYRLKVNETGLLGIWGVDMSPPQKAKAAGERVRPLRSWRPPQKVVWYVNFIRQGTPEYGTMRFAEADESDRRWNAYTAPAKVPDWNPAFIIARLVGASYKFHGRTFKNPSLTTHMLIYDEAYEVTIYHESGGGAGSVLGSVQYMDKGSFIIEVNGEHSSIPEKTNRNTIGVLDYNGCKPKILETGSGSIHLLDGETIYVTPATATTAAKVEIQFKTSKVVLPLIQFTCPPIGNKGKTTVTDNQMYRYAASFMSAMPMNIRFDALPGTQTLPGTIDRQGIFYKVVVRRLTPDD